MLVARSAACSLRPTRVLVRNLSSSQTQSIATLKQRRSSLTQRASVNSSSLPVVSTARSYFSSLSFENGNVNTSRAKPMKPRGDTPFGTRKTQRIRPTLDDLSFGEMKISPHVVGNLAIHNIIEPSGVQRLVIPHLIRRWDPAQQKVYVPPTVAIQDYTGSGKTIAYAAPIMSHVDNYIDKKLIPPQAVSVLNRLRGVTLDAPPLYQEPMTILDEKTRVKIIEYNDGDTFSTFGPTDRYDYPELDNNDEGELDGESALPTEDETCRYVTNAEGQRVGIPIAELARRRRVRNLRQKLEKIFPSINADLLNPENPQSRLQAVIVVPTRELAVQTGNVFQSLYSRGAKIRKVHPTVVTTCAGKVTRNMLNTLGVYLKNDPLDVNDAPETDEKGRPLPPPNHPFVEFGERHPMYRPDQDEIRKEAIQREKEAIAQAIETKERDRAMARLQALLREEQEARQDNNSDFDEDSPSSLTTRPSRDPQHEEMSYEFATNSTLAAQLGGAEGTQVEIDLERQPHVVIGTPETLSALFKSGALQLPSTSPDSLSHLKYLVFDEIDHLARSEDAYGHRAVLELLSLPNDQTVFVSASMTKDTAVLMARLARRQQLFKTPIQFNYTAKSHMEHLPRPEGYVYREKVPYVHKEKPEKVTYMDKIKASEPILTVSKPKTSFLDDEDTDETIRTPAEARAAEKKAAAAVASASGQQPVSRKKKSTVPVSNVPDETAEVLFLTTEDYKSLSLVGEKEKGSKKIDDAHSIPVAPYIKHYYIKLPRGVSKHSAMMDLVCQLKLLPQKKGRFAPSLQPLSERASSTDVSELVSVSSFPTFRERERGSESSTAFIDANDASKIFATPKLYVDPYRASNPNSSTLSKPVSSTDATTSPVEMTISTLPATTSPGTLPTNPQEVCPGGILAFFTNPLPIQKLGLHMQLKDASVKIGAYTEFSNRHDRAEVLKNNQNLDAILATETLSRGIDFRNLSMVLNVDVPRSTSVYLHRAGRVGRLGSPHRRRAVVVTLLEDPATVQRRVDTTSVFGRPSVDDELALKRHAKKLGIRVLPWPYKLPLKLHKACVRDHALLMSEERQKQIMDVRIRDRLADLRNAKRGGGKNSKNLGTRGTDGYSPAGFRVVNSDKGARKSQSLRSSLSDSKNWMTWDSNQKKWL